MKVENAIKRVQRYACIGFAEHELFGRSQNCKMRFWSFNNGVYRYEGRNIFIGKDVTTEAPQGNVVVKPNTTLTIKGIQSVQTTDNFEVKSGGTFKIE